MDYTKTLLEQYQKKINNVYNNINNRWGIFPNRNEPMQKLIGEEYILKTIYLLKVGFLEDFEVMFAYCYSKDKMQQIIRDLEKQGYITCQNTKAYGKCFLLTKTALHYIYNTDEKESYISEDKFPIQSKLMLYKVMNGYFSRLVFDERTRLLYEEYRKEKKDFRKDYQKEQYIKNFIYQSEGAYSKKDAVEFVAAFRDTLESTEEENTRYMEFIKAFRENRNDTFLTFAFLKDYYNQKYRNRQDALEKTFSILKGIFTNAFRDNPHKFKMDLYQLSGKKERLHTEYKLFLYSELIRIFSINKKALNNTNLDKKSVTELKELTARIQNLDTKIKEYGDVIQNLSNDYEAMVFEKYSTTDVPMFHTEVITLEKLKASNVYITGSTIQANGRIKLTFTIFQPNDDNITTTMLFQRLEKIFFYYINNLLNFDLQINIVAYTKEEIQSAKAKMKIVTDSFRELTQYGLLLPYLDEIEYISTKQHLEERYKIFKLFREKYRTF